jgi:hypothetical protein
LPVLATMNQISGCLLLLAAAVAGSCQREATAAYQPGLGEIMSLTQMRHCKLWFAGQAQNWELAAYEADELEEGFHDAAVYHPQHKSSPVPLTKAIPDFTAAPLKALRAAIELRDAARFAQAFDALTGGCNSCHLATNFAFNVVVRPAANAFPNQQFAASGQQGR